MAATTNRYRVTINMDNKTSVAHYSDQTTQDGADFATKGAINPYEWTDFHIPPTDPNNAKGIAQGMLRWTGITNELLKTGTFLHKDDWIDAEGMTTIDDQPTKLIFDLIYKEDPIAPYLAYLQAKNGNTNDYTGTPITTAEQVIRQAVAAGACRGGPYGWIASWRVFNAKTHSDVVTEFVLKQPDVPEKIIRDITVTLVTDGSVTGQAPGQGV